MKKKSKKIKRGVCRQCGCIEKRCCMPKGCYWMDDAKTRCSSCFIYPEAGEKGWVLRKSTIKGAVDTIEKESRGKQTR